MLRHAPQASSTWQRSAQQIYTSGALVLQCMSVHYVMDCLCCADNIETCGSDYYQRRNLTLQLGENDELWQQLSCSLPASLPGSLPDSLPAKRLRQT